MVDESNGENPTVAAFYTPERFANAFMFADPNDNTTFATTQGGILYVAVAQGKVDTIPDNTPVLAFPSPRHLVLYLDTLADIYQQFGIGDKIEGVDDGN